jgi:hypothetical protein
LIFLGLSQEDRDAVQAMDADMGLVDHDTAFDMIPPGDEGAHLSHEGGEYEVYQDLVGGLTEL